jgi:hypothetical protein
VDFQIGSDWQVQPDKRNSVGAYERGIERAGKQKARSTEAGTSRILRTCSEAQEGIGARDMNKNKNIGSSIEAFLVEEGTLDTATARAVKTIIAWQLTEELKRQ